MQPAANPNPTGTGTILVTGGTGVLGRAVVERLEAAGKQVRVLSRRLGPGPGGGRVVGDLGTGAGIEAAVAGADVIVHCASAGSAGKKARAVDLEGTRRLVEAARAAGAGAAGGAGGLPHLVYISIVGVDRVPVGYYRVKLATERLIEQSGLPWTVLRATQFHDLVAFMLELLARPPVLLLPRGISDQPVDTGEVADRMVALALGAPAGRVADIGGPQVLTVEELARTYLKAAGRRRPIVRVPLPGAAVRGMRAGGHLCPEHADGKRTWEEYLAGRFAAGSTSRPTYRLRGR